MSFNSLPFLIFLPIVLLVYWLLPDKAKPVFLLIASYFFYAYYNFWLVFLILSTTLIAYLFSLWMEISDGKKKVILVFYLLISLGTLFVFKYLDFTINSVISIADIFGAKIDSVVLNIILPVGISFYTFQTISYVVDVYSGKREPERNFIIFALFVSYFPQLVAGPIEKSENLIPQLKAQHHINLTDFSYGLQDLLKGYVKKIVVADFFAVFVNQIYGDIQGSSGVAILLATFFFGLEIYCDFSGYSDMARGMSRMMGIQLMVNFDKPYLSMDLKEFWNRWHVSLNDFFTEYVYIPLGGNKKGQARKCLNIFLVFLLSGIWHGAKLTFIIWGIAHGLLRILDNLLTPLRKGIKDKSNPILFKIGSVVITYLLVNFVWVFFRASSMNDALLAYGRIFTSFLSGTGMEYFDVTMVLKSLLCIAVMIFADYLPRLTFAKDENGRIDFKGLSSTTCLYAVLIVLVAFSWLYLLSTTGESQFIYFQF